MRAALELLAGGFSTQVRGVSVALEVMRVDNRLVGDADAFRSHHVEVYVRAQQTVYISDRPSRAAAESEASGAVTKKSALLGVIELHFADVLEYAIAARASSHFEYFRWVMRGGRRRRAWRPTSASRRSRPPGRAGRSDAPLDAVRRRRRVARVAARAAPVRARAAEMATVVVLRSRPACARATRRRPDLSALRIVGTGVHITESRRFDSEAVGAALKGPGQSELLMVWKKLTLEPRGFPLVKTLGSVTSDDAKTTYQTYTFEHPALQDALFCLGMERLETDQFWSTDDLAFKRITRVFAGRPRSAARGSTPCPRAREQWAFSGLRFTSADGERTLLGCLRGAHTLTSLHLANLGLTAEIPLALGAVKARGCYVDLSGNRAIRLASDARAVATEPHLDFSACSLTGPIPDALCACGALAQLNLEENEFEGEIPVALLRWKSSRAASSSCAATRPAPAGESRRARRGGRAARPRRPQPAGPHPREHRCARAAA